jgi:uncharacterized protein YndB with AHSA1/START domain
MEGYDFTKNKKGLLMENVAQSVNILTINRHFKAPRELVFKTWKNEELFKRWFGPKNFTCPHSSIDFRVGGKNTTCMRSPEGLEFWSTGIYQEIDEPRKIVSTDSFSDKDGNILSAADYGMKGDFPDVMTVRLFFEEEGNSTRFKLEHIGLPPGQMTEQTGKSWNESFDKLDALLAEIQSGSK